MENEKSIVQEILEVAFQKITPTLINGIQRQLDANEDNHDCATSICDYLGIGYRDNRAEIRKVLNERRKPTT